MSKHPKLTKAGDRWEVGRDWLTTIFAIGVIAAFLSVLGPAGVLWVIEQIGRW